MKLYSKFPAPRERRLYDMEVGRGVEQEVGMFLYGLVRMMKPRICIETGTHCGDSAEWIGRALYDNGPGRLFTCDTDLSKVESSRDRLKNFPVVILNALGEHVLRTLVPPFDFVFIDSGDPETREKELMLLDETNIAPGGVVCWHDASVDYQNMYEAFAPARDWPHLLLPSVVGLAVFVRPE